MKSKNVYCYPPMPSFRPCQQTKAPILISKSLASQFKVYRPGVNDIMCYACLPWRPIYALGALPFT